MEGRENEEESEEGNEEKYYNLLVSFSVGEKTYIYDITKAKLVKIFPTEELKEQLGDFARDYFKKAPFIFANARLAEEDKEKFRKINAEPENLEELLNYSFRRLKKFTPLSYPLFIRKCSSIQRMIVYSSMKTYRKLELQELRSKWE